MLVQIINLHTALHITVGTRIYREKYSLYINHIPTTTTTTTTTNDNNNNDDNTIDNANNKDDNKLW